MVDPVSARDLSKPLPRVEYIRPSHSGSRTQTQPVLEPISLEPLLDEVRQTSRAAMLAATKLIGLLPRFGEHRRTGDLNQANAVWGDVQVQLTTVRRQVEAMDLLRTRLERQEDAALQSFDSSRAIEGFVCFPEQMASAALLWPDFAPSDPWTPMAETLQAEARGAMKTYGRLWAAIQDLGESTNQRTTP